MTSAWWVPTVWRCERGRRRHEDRRHRHGAHLDAEGRQRCGGQSHRRFGEAQHAEGRIAPGEGEAAGTIVTPLLGAVSYTWIAADVDEPGLFHAEWEVTFSGGAKETFPNGRYLKVLFTEQIA